MERILSDIASGENILRNLRHVRENEIKICPIFDSIFDGIDLINQANIKGQLYLGPLSSTSDPIMLEQHNIKMIISITNFTIIHHLGITYHQFYVNDDPNENLLSWLDGACELIRDGLKNYSVLIHCNMGVSRSASVAIAFKGINDGIKSYDEVFRLVKKNRFCVNPNEGFRAQLEVFLLEG